MPIYNQNNLSVRKFIEFITVYLTLIIIVNLTVSACLNLTFINIWYAILLKYEFIFFDILMFRHDRSKSSSKPDYSEGRTKLLTIAIVYILVSLVVTVAAVVAE